MVKHYNVGCLTSLQFMPKKSRSWSLWLCGLSHIALQFINHRLLNSQVVESMTIDHKEKRGANKGLDIAKKLLGYPRASSKAKIIFKNWSHVCHKIMSVGSWEDQQISTTLMILFDEIDYLLCLWSCTYLISLRNGLLFSWSSCVLVQ